MALALASYKVAKIQCAKRGQRWEKDSLADALRARATYFDFCERGVSAEKAPKREGATKRRETSQKSGI